MNISGNSSKCICSFADACHKREETFNQKKKIVLTNGCFDLLHAGHIYSLEKASEFGDELWVALNSDSSVKSIKGNERPIFSENERAYMVSSLRFVSLVFIFNSTHLANEILALKPDAYVKSGDYSLETLNSDEKKSLNSVGAEIHFVPMLSGFSTTKIINNIADTNKNSRTAL